VTALLACAAALNYADRAAISSVFAVLRQDLALSDVALGTIGSVFLWSYALCSPIAGVVADRFSRSRVIVASLLLWSVVTLATGLASGLSTLILLRICLGAAESLYLPAANALIADHHEPRTRGTAMGLHSVGLNFGVVLGGTFAGYVAEYYNWRTGFYLLGGAGLTLAAVMLRGLRDGPARRTSARDDLGRDVWALLSIRSYLVLLVKAMLAGVGIWIFLNWLPLYFRDAFGMTLTAAGFAGTFMLQIATVGGIAAGGWLSDRVARTSARRRMLLQAFCYWLCAPFLLLFLLRPGFATVAVAVSAFSLFRGMGQANENPTLCDVVPPRLRSTAIGLMNCSATAAGGAGVWLAGYLSGTMGLNEVFAAVSLLFVVAGVVLAVGYTRFMPYDLERAASIVTEERQGNSTLAR